MLADEEHQTAGDSLLNPEELPQICNFMIYSLNYTETRVPPPVRNPTLYAPVTRMRTNLCSFWEGSKVTGTLIMH